MNKSSLLVAVIVAALAVPTFVNAAKKPAGAPDKTYSNGDFKFRINYPGQWDYKELEKPQMGEGKVNLPMGGSISIPKICNVNFAQNPDVGKKKSDDPNITLNVMTFTTSGVKGKKGERGEKGEKGEKGKSECVELEQKSVTWGGQKAMLITERCPETKKVSIGGKNKKATVWRYTTTVAMKHAGTQDIYSLLGEMLCSTSSDQLCDDMPDKGKAAEFDTKLKPVRDKMVSTLKFTK